MSSYFEILMQLDCILEGYWKATVRNTRNSSWRYKISFLESWTFWKVLTIQPIVLSSSSNQIVLKSQSYRYFYDMFYSKINSQTPSILSSKRFMIFYWQQSEGYLKLELLIWLCFQNIWFMGRFAWELTWKITKNSWIFHFYSSFFS